MERFSDLGNYLLETSKYANIEMTMVAKMKLIYPQICGEQSCVFHLPGSNGKGITIKEERDESNLGVFWNDLLQGTQLNVGFSAAVVAVDLFGHKWMPFIIVHSFTSYTFLAHQCFVKSLYSFLCLDKFWAEGTSSHKCHHPFTDSIVLLKQKWSKVKW